MSYLLIRMKDIFIDQTDMTWVLVILMTNVIVLVTFGNTYLLVPMLIDTWIYKLVYGLKEETFYP